MPPQRDPGQDALVRLFRVLLRLYPRDFRARYGASMEEAFTDQRADLADSGRARATARLVRSLGDLAFSGLVERLRPSHARRDPPSIPQQKGHMMDHLATDLRVAVRSLLRRPGFTAAALVTLSLGIGANTAVFTVVNGVLLRPLPFADADELVMIWSHDVENPGARGWMSLPDIDDVRELNVLDELEGWQGASFTVTSSEQSERVDGIRVTGGIMGLLGFTPLAGRDLRRDENHPEAARVVVIGYDFWQRHLDGRPDVVGTTLELSENDYEIVGIGPRSFDFPGGTELWVPYRHRLEGCPRGCSVYQALGRLADGVTPSVAEESLTALGARLEEAYPDANADKRFRAEPMLEFAVGDVRPGLWALFGAVGLVLLIVCANVANLLLVRASDRKTEVAMRWALGASRGRLLGQVLTESLVLAGTGGILGIFLSIGILDAFVTVAPVSLPRIDEVAIDPTVLLFALGLTLLVSLLFGASPALHLARGAGSGASTARARSSDTRREGRTRSALVAIEIALSLALLTGAGLLMRSLGELYTVDLGFNEREVVRFSLGLPESRYHDLDDIVPSFERLEERITALPGVLAVGSVQGAPLAGGNLGGYVIIEGRPEPEPGDETYGAMRPVTPGYFDALGLELLRGRPIERTDAGTTPPVAVVSETFVRQNFPDQNAIGERVRVLSSYGYGSPTWTIVGVVRDVRRTLSGEPAPEVYVPHAQFGPGFLQVHVRGGPGIGSLVPSIREEIRAMDPALVPTGFETIREAIRSDAANTRFYLLVVGIFAALAVLLASFGLYGVVSYSVRLRTREIGIRMALGARRNEIMRMVVTQGAAQVAAGVLVGVAISLVGARYLQSILFNVDPADPLVLGGVLVAVICVSMAAVLLPARRATRVAPTTALRME